MLAAQNTVFFTQLKCCDGEFVTMCVLLGIKLIGGYDCEHVELLLMCNYVEMENFLVIRA